MARAREHYVNWRGGVRTTNDEMNDEICLVRRMVPPTGDSFSSADANLTDSFEYAHAHLRRCLEQATAVDPCTPSGFHLTRIRGPVGSILHTPSDVRSYSAPGELPTRPAGGMSWSSGRNGHTGSEASYTSNSNTALGADIAECNWMSWL